MSTRIILSKQERERFLAWLTQDAAANERLLEVMLKNEHFNLAKRKKQHMEAFTIVATKLQDMER